METNLIDGRKIKEEILEELKREFASLSFVPIFCDILIGDDPVSASYVRIKSKNAEKVGIKFRTINFPNSVTEEELIAEINNLNNVPHICGIIVQLPLPNHLNRQKILDSINPNVDVDCLSSIASDKFYHNQEVLGYPTAIACLKVLDSIQIDLKDKNIVVLGQGMLVGRPVAHLLRSRGLTVETINRQTENFSFLLKNADIIISGVGKGKFIKGDMLKEGVVIIDAGTSEENGSVVGDVDFDSVNGIASFITPSPGGVGPVTVAVLLENVLKAAKKKRF